jgi:predicted branched-subunit amino acid permease
MSSTTASITEVAAVPSPVRLGAVAMLPLVIAYAPFAFVIGAAAGDHGTPIAGWAGSWLIYGGSAHLATIRTLDDAGPFLAIATGLLINARLLVYSAGLARSWPHQPRWFRVAAAGLIIDPTFVAAERFAARCEDVVAQRRHFIAAGLTLGAGWSAAIGLGAALGPRLGGLDVDIVVPLCLLALVGDALRVSGSRVVVVVAALIGAGTGSLPAGTGMLLAIAGGAGAGLAWERRSR